MCRKVNTFNLKGAVDQIEFLSTNRLFSLDSDVLSTRALRDGDSR